MYCKYSEPFWIDCNRKTFNHNTDTNNYQMIWTGMYSLSCEPIMLSSCEPIMSSSGLLSYSCLIEIKSFYRAVSNQDISCPWTGSDVPAMCVGSRTDGHTKIYQAGSTVKVLQVYLAVYSIFNFWRKAVSKKIKFTAECHTNYGTNYGTNVSIFH